MSETKTRMLTFDEYLKLKVCEYDRNKHRRIKKIPIVKAYHIGENYYIKSLDDEK